MRKAILVMTLTISLLLVTFANALPPNHGEEKSIYPTVTLYFSDGTSANITGKVWSGTIFPIVEGSIHSYDWSKKIKYLFFDKTLKGLNPYGLDFIRAMEKYTLKDFETNFYKLVNESMSDIKNLDSDGDGYTNIEELNAGTYPGDPDDHPGMNQEEFWNQYGGYITITVIVASIFVLYFVFNREKKD